MKLLHLTSYFSTGAFSQNCFSLVVYVSLYSFEEQTGFTSAEVEPSSMLDFIC